MSEQPAASAEAGEVPVKTGPKGVVLIGALVGSLAIGAAAGIFAIGPMAAKKAGYVVVASDSSSAGDHGEGEAADSAGHGAEGEGGGGAASNLHLIDNLVMNPAGSGGSRFLMMSAAIELREASQVEELKARDAETRDLVLRVMGARTVEELAETANREGLKKEMADSLGVFFKDKKAVRRVYFPQFVIQ
jgi:flagellar protein FliL